MSASGRKLSDYRLSPGHVDYSIHNCDRQGSQKARETAAKCSRSLPIRIPARACSFSTSQAPGSGCRLIAASRKCRWSLQATAGFTPFQPTRRRCPSSAPADVARPGGAGRSGAVNTRRCRLFTIAHLTSFKVTCCVDHLRPPSKLPLDIAGPLNLNHLLQPVVCLYSGHREKSAYIL